MFHDDGDIDQLMAQAFPQHLEAFRAMPLGVARSDVGRLLMMHVHGGFYFDTDYKLFRQIPADLMQAACILPSEWGDIAAATEADQGRIKFRIGNAVLGSQPGYALWADFIHNLFETDGTDTVNRANVVAMTGPRALTDFYLARAETYPGVVITDPNLFFPRLRYASAKVDHGATAIGVHLTWGSWRDLPLDARARILLRRKFAGLLCYLQDAV